MWPDRVLNPGCGSGVRPAADCATRPSRQGCVARHLKICSIERGLLSFFLQAVCGKLLVPYVGKELIQHLYEGINIYFNYTGTTKCLNISQQATSDLGDLGWDYQVYTSLFGLC